MYHYNAIVVTPAMAAPMPEGKGSKYSTLSFWNFPATTLLCALMLVTAQLSSSFAQSGSEPLVGGSIV